jgi:PBSX family phage portal protein
LAAKDIDLLQASREIDSSRMQLVKAHFIDAERPPTQTREDLDEVEQRFGLEGAIEPPYKPEVLTTLLEHSNSLRQSVDSYVTNIEAFGHHFEAQVDLRSDDAAQQVATIMWAARMHDLDDPALPDPNRQAELPTEQEVEAAMKELEEQMRLEKAQVKSFFDNVSLDFSFVTLRRRTRQDLEVLGNAYWEVIRSEDGELAQFNYIPGFTMRLMPISRRALKVEVPVRADDLTWARVTVHKRFRTAVQVFEGQAVYFKEYGDPRTISHMTGRAYEDEAALKKAEGESGAQPATEYLHFKIHSPRSAYGIPRWIGNLLAVLGSRQSEEVNYNYFENKSVPPLIMTVSGGRVTEDTITRLESFFDNRVKGKKNFHKMLIVEGENPFAQVGEHSGRMKIDVKPLTQAINSDALFQKYDERNIDKVGQSFRLPRMLRGDIRDFNRATAEAALEFAESQVFNPEREDFDWIINRKIMPELGIRFWCFKSNSPSLTDPMNLGKLVTDMTKEGILVPAEARALAETVFNREFRQLDAGWTKQPLSLTTAGIAPPPEPIVDPETGEELAPEVEVDDEDTKAFELTSTDLINVVTVNETREQVGLGPLQLQGGGDDPDGFLTVAEFKAKRGKKGELEGEADADVPDDKPSAPAPAPALPFGGDDDDDELDEEQLGLAMGDLGTGALAAAGGLKPAQADRLRRQPPKVPSVAKQALYLLSLRNAMATAEAAEAQREFEKAVADDADRTAE